jgi:protein gp37
MQNSHIEWTDHTFNPWEGCTKVSPGCTNCYAEARNQRFSGGENWGKGAPRRRTSIQNWKQPLKWDREARGEGRESLECPSCEAPWKECDCGFAQRRPRVFCASLADWLDDEVPIEWLADLLKLIHDTPNLDWQLLTKRPQNWRRRVEQVSERFRIAGDAIRMPWATSWLEGDSPENVWLGTSVENQEMADKRIPALLQIPAKVRFLSCEPLLEAVDLSHYIGYYPIYERDVQGKRDSRSGKAGTSGNFQRWDRVEASRIARESVERPSLASSSSKEESGARSRTVFSGSANDGRSQGDLSSSPTSLAALHRPDSGTVSDQSQERGQEGQSTGEFRAHNGQREPSPRVQGGNPRSTRAEESFCETDRLSGSSDPSDVSNGLQNTGSNSGTISRLAAGGIKNCEGRPEAEAEWSDPGLHSKTAAGHEAQELSGKISWVIVGGESGPGARPMHPDWARGLRDQCQVAGVPFLFKQWGEWWPEAGSGFTQWPEIDRKRPLLMPAHPGREGSDQHQVMQCRGKSKTGRVLDGRTWDDFPKVEVTT